jgi:hypothetical protein
MRKPFHTKGEKLMGGALLMDDGEVSAGRCPSTLALPQACRRTTCLVRRKGEAVSQRNAEADYARHWLVIQGLDCARRAALGRLSSPAESK